ncbi:hypothetical protein RFI_32622 [Reticulomyxa filosa]|uniref:Uncharacterized protein n=1 Tax=Reticulomyxa filosa TaxID=46433 RepID=X6LT02_RETFI|nr:hypothetical protein RFI_32622 [Reticulomyxa filosa]|eukprot:ETO04774.1 hypothetical protein RFI_32622 [Reticulomyxa filosa]
MQNMTIAAQEKKDNNRHQTMFLILVDKNFRKLLGIIIFLLVKKKTSASLKRKKYKNFSLFLQKELFDILNEIEHYITFIFFLHKKRFRGFFFGKEKHVRNYSSRQKNSFCLILYKKKRALIGLELKQQKNDTEICELKSQTMTKKKSFYDIYNNCNIFFQVFFMSLMKTFLF